MLHLWSIIFILLFLRAYGLVFTNSLTPDAALSVLWGANERSACLSDAVNGYGFADLNGEGFAAPVNGLSSFLKSGSNLFLVGDDVTGDLCELGSPGFCCSRARPCDGGGTMPHNETLEQSWEASLAEGREGWDALRRFALRTRNGYDMGGSFAYVMSATIPTAPNQAMQPVSLIKNFLKEVNAGAGDVMILGLLGWKQSVGLATFDAFTQGLLKQVVNQFPGRAVILSASPKHTSAPLFGRRITAERACLPDERPGERDPPPNSFQNAILVYNVWKDLANDRARLLDVHDMLISQGACHRDSSCRTWNDVVISLVTQLVLNTLQKLP